MASTQQALITATQICSWKGSMCTTMKRQVAGMFPAPSSWTLSQAQWTAYAQARSVNFFVPITLCSDRQGQAIIGRKDTTLKGRNSSIQCSMSCERKLKVVIVFKDS